MLQGLANLQEYPLKAPHAANTPAACSGSPLRAAQPKGCPPGGRCCPPIPVPEFCGGIARMQHNFNLPTKFSFDPKVGPFYRRRSQFRFLSRECAVFADITCINQLFTLNKKSCSDGLGGSMSTQKRIPSLAGIL